jgi:hypothetical protein
MMRENEGQGLTMTFLVSVTTMHLLKWSRGMMCESKEQRLTLQT